MARAAHRPAALMKVLLLVEGSTTRERGRTQQVACGGRRGSGTLWSAYTASKHRVIGLAYAVAEDAGPFGVTSNAVLPGWVRTAIADGTAMTEAERRGISLEQVWRERAAMYPQHRVLEPREGAQVITFLCSDAAGGVNGEAVTAALVVFGVTRSSLGCAEWSWIRCSQCLNVPRRECY
jgi:3-hydroxybutyrate dehydrogenase